MQRDAYMPLQQIEVLLESKVRVAGLVGLRTVRIVEAGEIDSEQKLSRALGDQAWKSFAGAMKLKQAYETQDRILMRQGYELLSSGRDLPKEFIEAACSFAPRQENPTRSVTYFLPDFMNFELKGASLVFWYNYRRKKFMPGILCPNFETAVYARVILSAHFGGGLRICPRCGKSFEPKRPDQTYDRMACREAHRVARWRARQKQGKKGKTRGHKKERKGGK